MPVEFRGNTGAPLAQLFNANGVAIEIDCSSNNTARLRSSADDGFAQANFDRTPPSTARDNDGNPDNVANDIEPINGWTFSQDTDFDFNNAVQLTGADNSFNTPADKSGIYHGTFGHTTNFALSQVVTGVYLASINTNTSPGNCVFVGTTQRD